MIKIPARLEGVSIIDGVLWGYALPTRRPCSLRQARSLLNTAKEKSLKVSVTASAKEIPGVLELLELFQDSSLEVYYI